MLVWGAGAIGGTVAAYLRRTGLDITVVDATAAHAQAIRDRGLSITGPIESLPSRYRLSPPTISTASGQQSSCAVPPLERLLALMRDVENGIQPQTSDNLARLTMATRDRADAHTL
jgi:glycine/D-amino acid oxidase-like deaminating enzyme